MVNFIFNILKTFPSSFWRVMAFFLGVSSITTPIAIAYIIVNSGSIEYRTGETEVNLKGKQIINQSLDNNAKLEEQVNKLIRSNIELTEAAKEKNVDKKLKPEIAVAEQAAVESKITLEDVSSSNKELKEFVDTRP